MSLRQTSVLGLSCDSSAEPFQECHMVSSSIGTALIGSAVPRGERGEAALHHCWDN